MNWVLGYLLIGFVLHFVCCQFGFHGGQAWYWELASVLGWPVTIVLGLVR